MQQIRKRLTYANVMSSIAVFLVLGGGAAFAATQLPKNSVGSPQIKKNAVKTGDIARNAVRVGKLAPEAAKAGKIAKNAIVTNRLRNNAVATDKIQNDAVTTDKVANDAITGDKVNEGTLGTVPNAVNAENAAPPAFARITAPGGADAANSKNVADANVTKVGTGAYCFNGLPFKPRNVQATVDWLGGGGDAIIHASVGDSGTCPGAEDASARIVDASTEAAVDRAFYITFVN